MPEIAEVETVRNVLKKSILHKRIIGVDIYYDKMIEGNVEEFKKCLINNEFVDIKRVGKWLIFELNKLSTSTKRIRPILALSHSSQALITICLYK